MATVTVNGVTYDSAVSFEGYDYKVAIVNFAADLLADTGRAMVTTSASTYTLGAGGGTITMAEAIPFAGGAFFILADQAAPTTNYALCQVSSRSATSLTFVEKDVEGSGTLSAWNITLASSQADAPSPVLSGTAVGAISMAGYQFTASYMVHQAGAVWQQTDLGSISGEQAITVASNGFLKATLSGDCVLKFAAPPTGYGYSKLVRLVQDATGGRTPTIELDDGSPSITATWLGTEPTWGDRAADAWNLLSVIVDPDGAIFVTPVSGS
jgi:hypothetical protein